MLDKQSGDRKSKSLSIINPSPEGSHSVVFTADTREELEEWIDCLHQHLYDQSECAYVSGKTYGLVFT